ncbi:MAG TPA: PqiC family protein [Luteolibacter sp.]|nr:PqiC family protein [Luteolibacter sp.]
MIKIIIFSAALLMVSCGVLRPVKDTSESHLLDPAVPERSVTGAKPTVAIARPRLPGYLDRQQFVSRGGGGRVMMNQNHLWAEPLDAGISRVTAANLGRLENSLNILPVESFITMDYDTLLEIRITRFESDQSGALVLECTWKLQPVNGPAVNPRSFRTVIAEGGPFAPTGPQNARVVAMNEALARLAQEISRAF